MVAVGMSCDNRRGDVGCQGLLCAQGWEINMYLASTNALAAESVITSSALRAFVFASCTERWNDTQTYLK